jgi:PAS domain S-box-containing protein
MATAPERFEQQQRLAAIAAERDQLLERMQLQFASMPAACVVVAPGGRLLQANPAFQRMFDLASADVHGRDVRDFVSDPDFLAGTLALLTQLQRRPQSTYTGVHANVTARGRGIVCRWTVSALRAQGGAVLGMIAMAENITEQIVAERALRSSEARYRALAAIAPVGIFRTDTDGNTLFVNDRACEIAGLTSAAALQLGWINAVHPADRPALVAAWTRYIESRGAAPYSPEFRMLRNDGSVTWVLTQIAPERDGEGNLTGHVGTITEITAAKVAQQALQEAHGQLEERVRERTSELEAARDVAERSDRVKTAFLQAMSHELRTPLNSILGFTNVVLQELSGPLTDAQARQLTIVRDSAARLRTLIEDVLDITRIEAGQVAFEVTAVDVHELAVRGLASVEVEAARKGIALRLDVASTPPRIRSDARRVSQIISNLLDNAVKFTARGTVSVVLTSHPGRIEIAVVDTGIGIAAHALDKLFRPFGQLAQPGGRLHVGTGLGLAVSRNLARALGGDVTVASEEHRGSCFKLWLPLDPAGMDEPPPLRGLQHLGPLSRNA